MQLTWLDYGLIVAVGLLFVLYSSEWRQNRRLREKLRNVSWKLGVVLTPEGHRQIARKIYEKLKSGRYDDRRRIQIVEDLGYHLGQAGGGPEQIGVSRRGYDEFITAVLHGENA